MVAIPRVLYRKMALVAPLRATNMRTPIAVSGTAIRINNRQLSSTPQPKARSYGNSRPFVIKHSIQLPKSLEPDRTFGKLNFKDSEKIWKILHDEAPGADSGGEVNLTTQRVEVKRVMTLDSFDSFKNGLEAFLKANGSKFRLRKGVPQSGENYTATLGGSKYFLTKPVAGPKPEGDGEHPDLSEEQFSLLGLLQVRARKYCELSQTFGASGFGVLKQSETIDKTWLEVKVRRAAQNTSVGDVVSKVRLLVKDKDLFKVFKAVGGNQKTQDQAIKRLGQCLSLSMNKRDEGAKVIEIMKLLLQRGVDFAPDMMMLYRRSSVEAAVDKFSFQLTWDQDVRIYPVKNTMDKESFEPGRTRIVGGPGFPTLPPGTVVVEAKIVPELDPKIHSAAAIQLHKLLLTSMENHAVVSDGRRRNAGKKGVFRDMLRQDKVLGSTQSPTDS